MALPKSKHIRKLSVANTKYYWTVKEDWSDQCLYLTVGLVAKPNVNFMVQFKFGASMIKSEDNIYGVVRPKTVNDAIVFAEANTDWKKTPNELLFVQSNDFMTRTQLQS